ncbi:MAG TPA: hypothetical protein VFN51_03050 [Candidatus Saccharimonadales bacterium]|nr:hypothetical protein [Candidatus Saccharimonadales bacterium]
MSDTPEEFPDTRSDIEAEDHELEEAEHALYEEVIGIVHHLGALSVPTALREAAKRREDSVETISVLLQLAGEEEELPDLSDPAVQAKLQEHVYNTALRIEFEDRDDFIEGMAKPSQTRHRGRSPKNRWSAVKAFEPYEHSAMERLQISIESDPYTAASHMVAAVAFKPSAFIGGSTGIAKLAGIKYVVEDLDPTGGAREPRHFAREDGGVGTYWAGEAEDEVLTTELAGLTYLIKFGFKGLPVEKDDKESVVQTEVRRKTLEDRLNMQLALLQRSFPQILENLNRTWLDEPLPEMIFHPRANQHEGEDLKDEYLDKDKDKHKEVPQEVNDNRQRELFLQTVQPVPEITFDMVGGLSDEKSRCKDL